MQRTARLTRSGEVECDRPAHSRLDGALVRLP